MCVRVCVCVVKLGKSISGSCNVHKYQVLLAIRMIKSVGDDYFIIDVHDNKENNGIDIISTVSVQKKNKTPKSLSFVR